MITDDDDSDDGDFFIGVYQPNLNVWRKIISLENILI